MREHDALDNNPHISRQALEALHGQLFGWALSRCGYDDATAEDLMQQAYVEVLSGKARFENRSTLKTFMFGVVQNLARSRFRRAEALPASPSRVAPSCARAGPVGACWT